MRKDEIRLNIDTKRMNKWVIPRKYPIPTPEEVRHELKDSDRFTILDARDAFHMFLLTNKSQDYFKFQTHIGIFRYKVLVMVLLLPAGIPRVNSENAGRTGRVHPDKR